MINKRSPQSNIINVVSALLKALEIKFNVEIVREKLLEHPNFPSLLAVNDILNEYNIITKSTSYNKELHDLNKYSYPFIAQFSEEELQFVLVDRKNDGSLVYTDQRDNQYPISDEVFLNKWTGIALEVELKIGSGEENYIRNKSAITINRLSSTGLIISMSTFLLINSIPLSYVNIGLVLVKVLGVVATIFLLMHSVNSKNSFVQSLCTFNRAINCNGILNSKAAKITEWLSWSEVGFFYFSGTLLLLLINPATTNILYYLNLVSLPYTVYSIAHQYRKKNWCLLCICVQILLWLEAIIMAQHLGIFSFPTINFTFISFITLSLIFLFPVFAWYFFKSTFTKSLQLKTLTKEFRKFKYNSDIFKYALHAQPYFETSDELMPVILGNMNSQKTITIITNPFCEPCSEVHRLMANWLMFRDDLQVKILFYISDDEDPDKLKFIRKILSVSQLDNKQTVWDALHEWYGNDSKNLDKWFKKYPPVEDLLFEDVINDQRQWYKRCDFTFTPTILVNGYKLPRQYKFEELKYLID